MCVLCSNVSVDIGESQTEAAICQLESIFQQKDNSLPFLFWPTLGAQYRNCWPLLKLVNSGNIKLIVFHSLLLSTICKLATINYQSLVIPISWAKNEQSVASLWNSFNFCNWETIITIKLSNPKLMLYDKQFLYMKFQKSI